MDRKTKQRLLGVGIIVGLLLVLLPFFQDKKEVVAETSIVQAPPFPEESVQLSADDSDDVITNQTPTIVGQRAVDSKQSIESHPEDPIKALHPSVIQSESTALPQPFNAELSNNDSAQDTVSAEPVSEIAPAVSPVVASNLQHSKSTQVDEPPVIKANKPVKHHGATVKNAVHKKRQAAPNASMKFASKAHQTGIENNGLFKLKSSVWVIQIGSFKNKSNAIRLVNKLRAKGYHAFIQQIGSSTRVFVGPENKQNLARMVAYQLKSDLKIDGVVVSYKPLTL